MDDHSICKEYAHQSGTPHGIGGARWIRCAAGRASGCFNPALVKALLRSQQNGSSNALQKQSLANEHFQRNREALRARSQDNGRQPDVANFQHEDDPFPQTKENRILPASRRVMHKSSTHVAYAATGTPAAPELPL